MHRQCRDWKGDVLELVVELGSSLSFFEEMAFRSDRVKDTEHDVFGADFSGRRAADC